MAPAPLFSGMFRYMNFIRQRSASLSMVVFMLFIIALLLGSIVSWLEHGFWPAGLKC
jgi:hypothetical protein